MRAAIKICHTCKKPFRAAAFPYVKFCAVECVDEAYTKRCLDEETMNYAIKLIQEDISEDGWRSLDTKALRELYFMKILEINHLISHEEYEEYKKDILD